MRVVGLSPLRSHSVGDSEIRFASDFPTILAWREFVLSAVCLVCPPFIIFTIHTHTMRGATSAVFSNNGSPRNHKQVALLTSSPNQWG